MARHGTARLGMAQQSMAQHGKAWHGMARHGVPSCASGCAPLMPPWTGAVGAQLGSSWFPSGSLKEAWGENRGKKSN